jgi:nicotinate phosphoribosyltransferase
MSDGDKRPPGLAGLYRPSLALLTDLYQLTMAYGYWKSRTHEKEAVFHLFFRQNPFGGGFTLACGLTRALEFIEGLRFDEEDLAYVATLAGNDGRPLFEAGFLDELRRMRFSCDVDAIPEGTVVFPHEPLLRIRGPILQGQLLETALLNIINFETLIATKAARIGIAAKGGPVLEFGLRRAQGIDGGLAASWAAYVGGASATSNVFAGRLYGIPVKGTHAHSWVMSFPDETEAFAAYAAAMPNNCIFLVDTYDTMTGVDHAIAVGRKLREQGHEMAGIRLDSGDLAYLSREARQKLDAAGFPKAIIVASNDLDEHLIASLRGQGAAIDSWGVGTRLVTGHDQPALGGVYKLSAIREAGQPWRYTVKLSEQAIKVNTPGILQVRRYTAAGEYAADVIYDEERGVQEPGQMIDPGDLTRRKALPAGTASEDLLVPVFREGRRVYECPSIHDIRARAQAQLALFHAGIKRFVNPHRYPVGLEARLFELKTELVLKARGLAV